MTRHWAVWGQWFGHDCIKHLVTISIAICFGSSTLKAGDLVAVINTNTGAATLELAPLPLKLPLIPSIESWYFPREEFGYPPKPRPPFLAPRGVTNIALGKLVKSSAKPRVYRASDQSKEAGDGPFMAPQAALQMITDGCKEDSDEQVVTLPRGLQWVQIDLGERNSIYAILVWHSIQNFYVFHDVVVQACDEPDFKQNVHTLFNNDKDNSSGLGVGSDQEYVELYEGKLIDAKGTRARYLRFSSNGNRWDDNNAYQEIEVYGLPVK